MALHNEISRRSLLLGGCMATIVAVVSPAMAATAESKGRKLVVVILRGAMDGLALLPKTDDPHIREHRAALIDAKAIPLADGFALHSGMPGLAGMYRGGQAAFIPAVAGPYRERSHFEAQDLLECGGVKTVSADGWLNRALQIAPAGYSAVSIGPVQPLILRGTSKATSSWSPAVLPEASEDTLARLMDMYEADAVLKPALVAAVGDAKIAMSMGAADKGVGGAGRGGPAQYVALLTAAGKFLAQPDGPEIAVVSLEGWDTHTQQNNLLNQRFQALDAGLKAVRETMGATWDKTVVVAVSEFGRTVRINGGGGTDHGTAGTIMLAGGAVKGGRVIGDWPGLAPAALFENRDLASTMDARGVFKGLLRDQLGWAAADLDRSVFPDSGAAKAVNGLLMA